MESWQIGAHCFVGHRETAERIWKELKDQLPADQQYALLQYLILPIRPSEEMQIAWDAQTPSGRIETSTLIKRKVQSLTFTDC